jgi:phage tail-like protein
MDQDHTDLTPSDGRAADGGYEGISRRTLLNGAGAVGGAVLASSLLTGTATAQTQPTSPITANRFSLVVDGVEIATFNELSGIVAEVDASEYWESSQNGVMVQKLPGKLKPPSVVLRRGMNGSMELWNWHEAVRRGTLSGARRSCSLIMFNSAGQPVARYFLTNAWPSKIELTGLKAGASETLVETVTITAESIQRVAPR